MNENAATKTNLERPLRNVQLVGLIVGVIAGLLAAAGYMLHGAFAFLRAYLFAYLFVLGLALGSLSLNMLHSLLGGDWGMLIRKTTAAASKTLWFCGLLFMPILLGVRWLYPWAHPEIVAADPLLQHKAAYLNIPFFSLRAGLYFLVWIFFAWRISRLSGQARAWEDPKRRRSLQRWSALGLMLYTLTMTFAALDWVMSLQPEWLSTIYGLLAIVSQTLSGMTLAIVILVGLSRYEPLSRFITARNYRDLGVIFLTLVASWAYLAYSQFMIIWSGNLPREISWYLTRSQGAWLWLLIIIVVIQFVIPFWFLISLRAKQNPRILLGLAGAVLFARLLDHYWEVMPVFSPQELRVHWLHAAMPLALGGLWLALFARYLQSGSGLLPASIRLGAQEEQNSHASMPDASLTANGES